MAGKSHRSITPRICSYFTPTLYYFRRLFHLFSFCHCARLDSFRGCWFMKQSSASMVNCSSIERNALIDFKQKLLDPTNRLSSWVGHNCCEWHGVTCDFISGMVTKIDLRNTKDPANDFLRFKNTSLGGDISSSLLHLHHLSYLDLSLNYFAGTTIPYFFSKLKNLRYLNLSYANFGGEIPTHLGNLTDLNYLDLSANHQLRVENLNWLSGLSSLRYLDLGEVDLSKTQKNWMDLIYKLSSLTELHLKYCLISSLDSLMGLQNLTSLRVLQLSQNYWNNFSLPSWLFNLTTLTKLDLSASGLQGTISPDFMKLKNLQHLDLSANRWRNIRNHKPFLLLNLCELRFANLNDNYGFGGKLDELLGSSSNCTHNNLESLNLSYNDLEGEIPNSLGILDKLQHLDLSYNKLWGSLPSSIGNLSSLQYLDLSFNHFNGIIPPSFGQLSELISFQSYDNSWKGVVTETHLLNLKKLKLFVIIIDTNHDALLFNISYNWIPPFKLKTLRLTNCLVGPRFPIWLRVQTKLVDEVIISQAGISGSIPNEWISLVSSRITILDLSNNLLEGKLSQLLVARTHLVNRSRNHIGDHRLISLRYSNLRFLFLQNNLLAGSIPQNIGDSMPNLEFLILSKNHLNGKINPSYLEKMSTLVVLSSSHNRFFGELSDDWGKLKSLHIIDLANNNLYGRIPSSMGLLTHIRQLVLNNNNFIGEIPKSLRNCSNMESIDLSGNRLHGSLPVWIGVVGSELKLLNLRSNSFIGTIPRQWCNLSRLRVFDLSNNNIVGEVPSCLSKWISFIYDDKSGGYDHFSWDYNSSDSPYVERTTLFMKGMELQYDITLKYVFTIDLSRNKLSGEIPYEITKLVQLGTLNLSNNELIGAIRENIVQQNVIFENNKQL